MLAVTLYERKSSRLGVAVLNTIDAWTARVSVDISNLGRLVGIRLLDIPRLSAPKATSPTWQISDLSPAICPSTGPIRSRKTVHTASRAKFSIFKAQYRSLQAVGVGLGTIGIHLLLKFPASMIHRPALTLVRPKTVS